MPPDLHSSRIHSPHYGLPPPAGHVAAIVTTATHAPSAADTQMATRAKVPNPLWAINIGIGVFLVVAALVVMVG